MHDARSIDRMKGEYRMKKKDRSVNFKKIAAVVIAFAVMLSMITIPEKTAYAASGTVKSIIVTNVSDKQLTLKKGKTFTLKTKVKVTGKASKKVIYKTSDPKVVTVNSKGKITAKKNGKATVTIISKANSKKKCKITVMVGTVKNVSVTNLPANQLTLKKGKTFTVKPKVTVTGKASQKVSYKSSNKKVATVNSKGKITAKKNGKATITITSKADSKKKYKISVTVGTPVTSVKLSASSVPLITGKSMKVQSVIAPASASNKGFIWTSSDSAIATVSSSGVVSAKKAGTVTITATAKDGSGKKAACKIKVINPLKITSLKATDACTIQIKISDAYKLAASDFAVMTKEYGVGSYRKNCIIDTVSTTDNQTYTIVLNKNTPIVENHYVQVRLTNHNTAGEGTYSKGVFNYTSASTTSQKLGIMIEPIEYDLSDFGFASVSVTGVPAGIQYEVLSEGTKESVCFSGTPSKLGKFTTVIKHTDELGNTYTRNMTWLIYDDTHMYATSTTSYVVAPTARRLYNGKITTKGGSGNYSYSFEDDLTTLTGDGYKVELVGKNVYGKFEKAGVYTFTVIITDEENAALKTTTQIVFDVTMGREITTNIKDLSGNPIPKAYIRWENSDLANKYSASLYGYASSSGILKSTLDDGTYTLTIKSDYYTHFRYEYLLKINADKEMDITLPLYKVEVTLDNADIPADDYGRWYDETGACVGEGNTLYLEKGTYNLRMTTTGTTKQDAVLLITVNGASSATAEIVE